MSIAPQTIRMGVIASAGSKIMMTGGYLVLNRPNNGLVIGVDARLYTGIYPLSTKFPDISTTIDDTTTYPVIVLTPQRTTTPLNLTISLSTQTETPVQSPTGATSPFNIAITGDCHLNTFVSKSLHYSLIAISSLVPPTIFQSILKRGLLLDIRGDRQFYSSVPIINEIIDPPQKYILNGATITTERITHDNPTDYTTKTGLGSSAAVVSSLVSALFSYFGLIQPSPQPLTIISNLPASIISPETSTEDQLKRYAYRVAQIAHCIAQGKVGSGFDVSTAFYGTQQYCRFSPDLINSLIKTPLESAQGTPSSTIETNGLLLSALFGPWDDHIAPFNLPPMINVIVADVQGGSETPGMVKKVNEWLATYAGAEQTWSKLAGFNSDVEDIFITLNTLTVQRPEDWLTVVRYAAERPAREWETTSISAPGEFELIQALISLRDKFLQIRALLKQIGDEAGVPIEPDSQTSLLNQTCAQKGVILAGVPGAGGFDAIFTLVLDVKNVTTNTSNIVECWKGIKLNGATDDACIQQLNINVDQCGGIQISVVYKDFPSMTPQMFPEAAEQSNVDAQYSLGNMYRDDQGVEQSDQEAFKWFKKAAEQGNVDAQNNLGVMYRDGKGVEQSDQEAFNWFKKAAEQGNCKAQHFLDELNKDIEQR